MGGAGDPGRARNRQLRGRSPMLYPVKLHGRKEGPLITFVATNERRYIRNGPARAFGGRIGTGSSTEVRDHEASSLTSQAYGGPGLDCIQNGSDQPQARSGRRA